MNLSTFSFDSIKQFAIILAKSIVFVIAFIMLCTPVEYISLAYPWNQRERQIQESVRTKLSMIADNHQEMKLLAFGSSHGNALHLKRIRSCSENFTLPWADIFEIDYQVRYLVSVCGNVNTVVICMSPNTLSWDNGSRTDRVAGAFSRRIIYYEYPVMGLIDWDYRNFFKGKSYAVARPDHYRHVVEGVLLDNMDDQQHVVRRDFSRNGEVAISKIAMDRATTFNRRYKAMVENDPELSEKCEAVFLDLLNFLQLTDIRIICYTPPYYYIFTESIADELKEVMRLRMPAIADKMGIEYYDFSADSDFVFDSALYHDSDHLSHQGRARFTSKFMRAIF